MKNAQDKYISISDVANEFHVSESSIELYGIHRLLLPIPANKTNAFYRPLDKVRLKFITRAKSADYSIGNIKALIGVLDLEKDETAQTEECLAYCKIKSLELKNSLKDLDVLEHIDITCDIELLETYITDLNNLKYGLNDIAPKKTVLPGPDTETPPAKPRTPVYSHIVDPVNVTAPAVEPKTSRIPLVVVAGILLVAISVYFYLGGDPVPDTAKNLAAPLQMEPPEMTAATSDLNEADEINLSESDTNPDENGGTPANESDSRKDTFSLLDNPVFNNELNPASDDPVKSWLETYPDKPTQDSADVFFKQLVADLNKKYDESVQSQTPAANDTAERNATPNKKSKGKEIQKTAPAAVPNKAPQASKTTAASKTLKETKGKSTTATTKTSLKQTTTAPPKKVAPIVVTQAPSSLNTVTSSASAGLPRLSAGSPETPSVVIQTETPAKSPAKKTETPRLTKTDASVTPTIEAPKTKQETRPREPANPEALKWAQKSYESVMNGDAGEAIITASVALTLDPRLVNAYINRSWAYSKKGLYDKAIQDCDKALNFDTNNALAYNNRGLAFQGKGDMDKAKADYERACKLGFDLGCKNYQEVVGVMADNS